MIESRINSKIFYCLYVHKPCDLFDIIARSAPWFIFGKRWYKPGLKFFSKLMKNTIIRHRTNQWWQRTKTFPNKYKHAEKQFVITFKNPAQKSLISTKSRKWQKHPNETMHILRNTVPGTQQSGKSIFEGGTEMRESETFASIKARLHKL